MNLETIANWGWLAALVLQGLLTWTSWSMRKAYASSSEVANLERKLQEESSARQMLELKLHSMPTIAAFHALVERIGGIAGDVKAAATEINGVGAGLKRIENQVALLMENELRGNRQ